MCKFWSAVIDRTGKVYHLGEITSHEKVIEKFKLKDGDMNNICRIEIPVIDKFDFLPETKWQVKIDQPETPSWLTEEMKNSAIKTFSSWNTVVFQKKWKRFKKLNAHNEQPTKMKGEEIIWREKLTSAHEKLIMKFYLLGEKKSWYSVLDSVLDFVRDSVWYSVGYFVGYSVLDSVLDSVRDSVRDSARDSVLDSVLDSVWYSVLDSVWHSVLDSGWHSAFLNKPYPLALPKKIFDLGYIYCLVKENDNISRIHVYGKRGKLLKKIDFKDADGKILIKVKE